MWKMYSKFRWRSIEVLKLLISFLAPTSRATKASFQLLASQSFPRGREKQKFPSKPISFLGEFKLKFNSRWRNQDEKIPTLKGKAQMFAGYES